MILRELFNERNVRLWGVASLEGVIEGATGYKCIAFGLPYDSDAIAALPDDRFIDCCRKELSARTQAIYAAIRETLPKCNFESYDDVDSQLSLRQKRVSQKVLGYLAGLGWIGKSSLLVSPDIGPRMRLGTIFTRDDLEGTDSPCDGGCGDCTVCSETCPIGAITESGYDVGRCRQIVMDDEGNYKTFCGLCMKVCPQGNDNNAMHTEVDKPHR